MVPFKNESMKQLYTEKLLLAKGDHSINAFAHLTGVSPGNMWKIMHGQIAKPDTLQKIASVRPDLDFLYEELMFTAGYITAPPKTLCSEKRTFSDEYKETMIRIPVLKKLIGTKNKLMQATDCTYYNFPNYQLGKGKYFFYQMETEDLEPKVHEGDYVLFDMAAKPKEHDVVLFRINKNEGLVRYYSKKNSKIIAYSSCAEQTPLLYNKGEIEVLGVAISAIIRL